MNALALVLLSAAALADPRAVYRVPVRAEGALAPAEVEALQQRVDEQLVGSGFELRAPDDPARCDAPTCWRAEADAAQAAYALEMSVDATQADQRITLALTDVTSGTTVAEVSQTCELCGRDELLDAVSDVAATGLRKLDSYASVSTTLRVDSVPPGARVLIDGEDLGETPVELEVTPGPHEVELAADGHVPLSESIEVQRGTSERMRLYLSPTPADVPAEQAPRRGRVIAGATLAAGGVVGLAAGITLLVLHGRPVASDCSGDDVDLDGDCHFLHDTRLGGAIGTSLGGAALITGSVLLGLELGRRRSSSVSVAPTGNGVLLSGRF